MLLYPTITRTASYGMNALADEDSGVGRNGAQFWCLRPLLRHIAR
jgi:hypothetical protein